MQLFGVTLENIVSQQCNLFPFNTSHFAFIQSTKLLQQVFRELFHPEKTIPSVI